MTKKIKADGDLFESIDLEPLESLDLANVLQVIDFDFDPSALELDPLDLAFIDADPAF